MKAVKFDRYGDASVLEVRTVDARTPSPARSSSRCSQPASTRARSPSEDRPKEIAPAHFLEVQGSDFAGRVAGAGDGVTDVAVGASVIGMPDGCNAQSEYVTIAPDRVLPKLADLQWTSPGHYMSRGRRRNRSCGRSHRKQAER